MPKNENNPLSALFQGLINSIGSMIPPDFCYVIKNNADDGLIHCGNDGSMVIWTDKEKANKCKGYLEREQEIECTIHTYDWNSLVKEYHSRISHVIIDPPSDEENNHTYYIMPLEEY